MSKQTIGKEVEATICEFCDKEIDTKSGDYCYHHLVRFKDSDIFRASSYKVTHYLFFWRRNPIEYIQYDFHAACFDELMRKFLLEKSGDKA